ncbi:MAG: hypothetical protein ACPGEF_04345, partial [Endozoicomonas sp.]
MTIGKTDNLGTGYSVNLNQPEIITSQSFCRSSLDTVNEAESVSHQNSLRTPMTERKITTVISPEEQESQFLAALSNLTEEQKNTLITKLETSHGLSKSTAKKAVSNFIIEIKKPQSFIHGLLIVVCLFSSFGTSAFILDKNSTLFDVVAAIVGSFAQGAISIDSIDGLPVNLRESWRELSGVKKCLIAIFSAGMLEATAGDTYRTASEALQNARLGQARAALLGCSSFITVAGSGAEVIKLLSDLLPQWKQCQHFSPWKIILTILMGGYAISSAYFVQLGTEQWTNNFLINHAAPSLAYSPLGHCLLGIAMSPHFIVYSVLQTWAGATLMFDFIDITRMACNNSYQRIGTGGSNAHSITQTLKRFFLSSKTHFAVNSMATLTLAGVLISALYKDWLYLHAISDDTEEQSNHFGIMADNKTLIDDLGLHSHDLTSIQSWAHIDAIGNRVTLYARLAMTLAISGYQLRNALGMVAGVPIAIYDWFKGNTAAEAKGELMIREIETEFPEFKEFA